MADGTRISEPAEGTTVDSTEVTFGVEDVRDRQRVSLAGTSANSDVSVSGAALHTRVQNLPTHYALPPDQLAALREIVANVTGSVALDPATLTALEAVTVSGVVGLDVATLAALESVAVTATLDAASLAALEQITATISNLPASYPLPTEQVDALKPPAVQPISGTVSVDNLPQTAGLTDTELRASPVNVSAALKDATGAAYTTANPLPTVVTSNGGQPVFVRTSDPQPADPGLVVRVAGEVATNAEVHHAGSPVSDVNPLPVKSWILSDTGAPFSASNPLPVNIGTATIQASFDSVVSTANSRNTPLAANETFTGAWEVVTDFAAISVAVSTDKGTPYGGAQAQFSIDGVNVVTTAYTTLGPAGGSAYFTLAPQASYFRIVYTNGDQAQTFLRAEVTYHFNAPGQVQAPVAAPTDDSTTATVTKATMHGRHSSGLWSALKATADGVLSVQVDNTEVLPVGFENGRITGTLTAASPTAAAAQTYWPVTPATSLKIEVPDGHSSSVVEIRGNFGPNSGIVFEQSESGLDGTWAATNMRRNTTPDVNESFSQIDNNPVGTSNVQVWKGTVGGIRFFRVRCDQLAPGDAPIVSVATSPGVGGTFLLGNPPSVSDYFADGTLTAVGQTIQVRCTGMGTGAAALVGQFSGRVHFEISVDGVTWRPASAVTARGENAQFVTGTGTPGQVLGARAPIGGVRLWRIRAGDDFVGSLVGTLRAGAGSSSLFIAAPIQIGGLYTGSQTNRFSVGLTSVRLDPAALSERKSIEILYQANGAANNGVVYVGFSTAVTASNGRALQPGESWVLDVSAATTVFAIATAAAQQVQVTELA